MRNLCIIVLIAVSMTIACTKNGLENASPLEPQAIDFEVSDSQIDYLTRASVSSSIYDIYDIGIFAFNTLDESWDSAAENAVPNLFNNVVLVRSGSTWSYDPVQYWPDLGSSNVSFFAYSPHHSSTSSITAPSADYDKGIPSIDYSLDPLSANHIDLLVSTSQIDVSGGAVNLHLNHSLAKVGFKASLTSQIPDQKSYISGIEIDFRPSAGAVYGTATLDLHTMEWDFLRDELSAAIEDLALPSEPVILSSTALTIIDESGYMLMIPQDIATGAIVINMTMTTVLADGSTAEQVFSEIEIPAHSWDMGKGHDYLLSINAQDQTVEVSSSVADWDQAAVDDIEINDQHYLWVESGSLELTYERQSTYIYVETNYPDGFTAEVDDGNAWIRNFQVYSNMIYFHSRTNNSSNELDATITITAGNIVREIEIVKQTNK